MIKKTVWEVTVRESTVGRKAKARALELLGQRLGGTMELSVGFVEAYLHGMGWLVDFEDWEVLMCIKALISGSMDMEGGERLNAYCQED